METNRQEMDAAELDLKSAKKALAVAIENHKLALEERIASPTAKSAWMREQLLREKKEAVDLAEQFVEKANKVFLTAVADAWKLYHASEAERLKAIDAKRSHRNEPAEGKIEQLNSRVFDRR